MFYRLSECVYIIGLNIYKRSPESVCFTIDVSKKPLSCISNECAFVALPSESYFMDLVCG